MLKKISSFEGGGEQGARPRGPLGQKAERVCAMSKNSHPSFEEMNSLFLDEKETCEGKKAEDKHAERWNLLIVDDDEDVHRVTRMILDELTFENRGITLLSAFSGEEAKKILAEHPDTVLVLLDVVMETDHAGLDVVEYVRKQLGNRFVRIVLRTGQPGVAPLREVIQQFDIDDYREKSRLTSDEFLSVVAAAIRAYQKMRGLWEEKRRYEDTCQRMKERLFVDEKRLHLALAGTGNGIWEWDLTTGEIIADDMAQKMIGYEPGEHRFDLEHWFLPNIRPEDRVKFQEAFNAYREGRAPYYELEFKLRTRGGQWIWLLARGIFDAFDEKGNPTHLIGIYRDISKRKEAEEALQKTKEHLEELVELRTRELIQSERMAAVGMLAAGVAHEYNNIHTSLNGFLELALEHPMSNAARRSVERARRAAWRAAQVTRNLLDFSHPSKAARSVFDLKDLVEETLRIVQSDLHHENIQVVLDYHKEARVFADRSQLDHVLINLLFNAKHALMGRQEKRITIRTGVEGERAFFSVSDNGCGIPVEHRDKIFLPFFTTKGEYAQAGDPMSRVRGRGLGLSVCETIVRHHGGTIDVQSVPGEGSTFTVWLPSTLEMPQPPRLADSTSDPRRSARILIVDDESDIRELIEAILESEGWEIVSAEDGETALRLHTQTPFDLIVIDLQMPKMLGIELIRDLQHLSPDRHPAMIVMTGKATSLDHDFPPELENLPILKKPFTADALRSLVAEKLRTLRPSS